MQPGSKELHDAAQAAVGLCDSPRTLQARQPGRRHFAGYQTRNRAAFAIRNRSMDRRGIKYGWDMMEKLLKQDMKFVRSHVLVAQETEKGERPVTLRIAICAVC
jgi:hypothetical protein